MRSLLLRTRMWVIIVTLLAVASACTTTTTLTADDVPTAEERAAAEAEARRFAATPAYLARVSARAQQVQSMRFEAFTSVESTLFSSGSRTTPVLIGEQDGRSSRVQLDMATMMGPMAGLTGLNPNSLSMTMISDGEAVYLNAPILAELATAGGFADDYQWVRDLAAGWGRIDDSAFGGGDLLADMGMSGAGTTEMLALLEDVGDVLDGGTGEVRGVPVRIAHAEVGVMDIVDQAGQDLRDSGLRGSDIDKLRDVTANIAVHVDDDGMARRLEYTLDFGALFAGDPNLQGVSMTMWQRIDFFDYDAAVDIAIPTVSTDITSEIEDLLDALG